MDFSRQKVVFCGEGGFIGGHLIKQLLRDGVHMIRSVDVKLRCADYQAHTDVENVTADLTYDRIDSQVEALPCV